MKMFPLVIIQEGLRCKMLHRTMPANGAICQRVASNHAFVKTLVVITCEGFLGYFLVVVVVVGEFAHFSAEKDAIRYSPMSGVTARLCSHIQTHAGCHRLCLQCCFPPHRPVLLPGNPHRLGDNE